MDSSPNSIQCITVFSGSDVLLFEAKTSRSTELKFQGTGYNIFARKLFIFFLDSLSHVGTRHPGFTGDTRVTEVLASFENQ